MSSSTTTRRWWNWKVHKLWNESNDNYQQNHRLTNVQRGFLSCRLKKREKEESSPTPSSRCSVSDVFSNSSQGFLLGIEEENQRRNRKKLRLVLVKRSTCLTFRFLIIKTRKRDARLLFCLIFSFFLSRSESKGKKMHKRVEKFVANRIRLDRFCFSFNFTLNFAFVRRRRRRRNVEIDG